LRTVYTAIFGNYDDLKEPFVITNGWRYICYTDQDLKSDVWEIRKVPVMECGPQKTARYYKIMFHESVEDPESLWVDATFFINCDLNEWWKRYTYPFTTIKHPFDDCIYKETKACQGAGKGNYIVLKNQIDCYRRLGVKKHDGLIASGVLMRKMTPQVIEFCKLWWKQVHQWSPRDQIAFGYVQHKMPGVHNSINWNYTTQDEFIHIPHLTKKWRIGKYIEVMNKYGNKTH